MLTCKEAEKMVMPYIDEELGEKELDAFLEHIKDCSLCREELEIYYTVAVGLRQLDSGAGVYDITGGKSGFSLVKGAGSAVAEGDLLWSGDGFYHRSADCIDFAAAYLVAGGIF